MGDRATFVIEHNKVDAPIFINGHWAGYEMLNEFAQAIHHALPRIEMDDPIYATRMIFNFLTRQTPMEETGWGISSYYCDSEHSIPVLNVHDKTVRLLPRPEWGEKFDINAEPKFVMPVDKFIDRFAKVLV